MVLLASACGGGALSTTVAPVTTVAPTVVDLIDGEFLAGLLENSLVDGELGAVLAVVSDRTGRLRSQVLEVIRKA